jgi:class 3 adenylate cyclase
MTEPAKRSPVIAPLDLEHFNQILLNNVGVAIALFDLNTMQILFNNVKFHELFKDHAANATIDQILGLPEMPEKVQLGEIWSQEIEIKIKRRSSSLAVQISRHALAGQDVGVVECHNISKIKELEYMLESYSKMVEKNARELRREKERAERLLLNVMPKTVVEELKEFGVTTPQRYDEASVLMLDFVGFTEMSISHDPTAIVSELNDIFTAFDRIVEQFGCERIKTIGDAYMAVSGIPDPTVDHLQNIAHTALLFRRYIERRNRTSAVKWECRIGIATGPVIGSIIGVQKYVYDIFGPGVNLASRMESVSGPMQITMPASVNERIAQDFQTKPAGEHEIRGFGKLELYHLIRSIDKQGHYIL